MLLIFHKRLLFFVKMFTCLYVILLSNNISAQDTTKYNVKKMSGYFVYCKQYYSSIDNIRQNDFILYLGVSLPDSLENFPRYFLRLNQDSLFNNTPPIIWLNRVGSIPFTINIHEEFLQIEHDKRMEMIAKIEKSIQYLQQEMQLNSLLNYDIERRYTGSVTHTKFIIFKSNMEFLETNSRFTIKFSGEHDFMPQIKRIEKKNIKCYLPFLP